MNKITLNIENFEFSENQINIKLPDNFKSVKIINAFISVKILSILNVPYTVNYVDEIYNSGWTNVDQIKGKSMDLLKINVSDELQDAIDKNANKIVLQFIGPNNEKIEFSDDMNVTFFDVEYTSQSEYQENGSDYSIDINSLGTLNVNLVSGMTSLKVPIINTNNSKLPLCINLNYNQLINEFFNKIGIGLNFSLSLNQFLIKNRTESQIYKTSHSKVVDTFGDVEHLHAIIETTIHDPLDYTKNIGQVQGLNFTYYDKDGKQQIIEEKYYYKDENKSKTYVNKDKIEVDLNGQLIYKVDENNIYEIKSELIAPSGLKLLSSIEDFKGAKYLDYEPEELVNVREQLNNIDESMKNIDINIGFLKEQIISTVVSKGSYIKELKNLKGYYEDESNNVEKSNFQLGKIKYVETISRESFCTLLFNHLGEERSKIFTLDDWNNFYLKWTSNELGAVTYSSIELLNADRNIENLYQNIVNYTQNKEDLEDKKIKLENQLKLLEMQVPVYYLQDNDGFYYGFGRTNINSGEEVNKEIYKLITIFDEYENNIFIKYKNIESYKITDIISSDGNEVHFDYENNLLTNISSNSGDKLSFSHAFNGLIEIDKNDTKIKFIYTNLNKFSSIINNKGYGVKFSYDELTDKVIRLDKVSALEKIENGKEKYKDGFDFENLENIDQFINEKDCIKFSYENYKSTSVTNAKNKTLTYIFDKFGKVKTIYDGIFNEESNEFKVNVLNYVYQNSKVSQKISNMPYSDNYFKDVCFKATTTEDMLYLNDNNLICNNTFMYKQIMHNSFLHKLPDEKGNNIDQMTMSKEMLHLLNSNENICSHKIFIASCWAKANSAFIVDDEDEEFANYVKNRKFDIEIKVEYEDGDEEAFYQNFDWRNTEWQYCSLPINLKNKEIKSVIGYINYSNNTNEIEYTDIELVEGDYQAVEYDKFERPICLYSAHNNWETKYEYEDDSKRICNQIITNKEDPEQKYITTFEYSLNGSLRKSIDYNGIVRENIYNDNGILIKTLIYHKDDPTSKFYNERNIDDKGNETGLLNELGSEISNYEYIKDRGVVSLQTISDGTKIAYGYDKNNILKSITSAIDGIENTNIYDYTLDHLTSLEHNDFKYFYDYDDESRVTKIDIANENYLKKTYGEDIETTIFATKNEYIQKYNEDGKLTEIYYKSGPDAEEKLLLQNIYDSLGNIVVINDYTNGMLSQKNFIDNFGNTYKIEAEQHKSMLKIENNYDENHENIKRTSIKIGDDEFAYDYSLSNNPDSNLNSITISSKLNDETTQEISYDRLQRIKDIKTDNLTKQYSYLKSGDHATMYVSNEQFAIGENINENLRYKYDCNGNIIEIRNNNELVARYKYDGLSRLIREDNKDFNKTTTFIYDAGGNILTRLEYDFTLIDNLENEEIKNIFNYAYPIKGWKDQLKEYSYMKEVDGKLKKVIEEFVYDKLGNPEKYRNKTLEWSHGRQLHKFEDIEYTYNANGIRTSKKVDNKTTEFYINGTQILRQDDGINKLDFLYGADGILGFILNEEKYIYKKNMLGDIIGIINSSGVEIARYAYDAWGNHKYYILSDSGEYKEFNKILIASETEKEYNKIVNLNPFRYRGYYFDVETNLYYLNSRYYDPELGRFINADDISIMSITKEYLNGLNLYSYCLNNPVNEIDNEGYFIGVAIFIGILIGATVGGAFAYSVAKSNGYTGADLVGMTILGILGGGILGGAIGAGIAYLLPSISSMGGFGAGLGLSFAGEGSAVLGGTIAIDSVLEILGIISVVGTGIMFTRIGKSGGYRIDHHYPNDHKPPHVHISGDDGKTKVDITGKPLPGQRPMTPGESKAFWKLIKEIIEALSKWL